MRTFSIYVKTLSTSTLMQMKKAELVEYVRMCEKNMAEAYATLDQQAANFKKLLDEKTAASQWIPCSEMLPVELEPVNITWVNRRPASYYSEIKDVPFSGTGIFFGGKWWWYSVYCEDNLAEYGKSLGDEMDKDLEVTAWQPLPEPYKGVE